MLLPHDREAERGVLGAILHDNDALIQTADIIQAEQFFSPAHRLIFAAMLALFERQDPIDDITLAGHLRARNELDAVGGPLYITELLDAVPVSANVLVYAEIVLQKFQLRSLIASAVEIANKGREQQEDVSGLIQEAEGVFSALANSSTSRSYMELRHVLNDNFKNLEQLQERGDTFTGVPTGFPALDELTNGLQNSELIILASRPSMGKTSLAMNIANHAAIHTQQPVLVFTLEMSKEQLGYRLLCSEGKVNNQKLVRGDLSEDDWDRLVRASSTLSRARLFIDETPEVTPLLVRTIARRLHMEQRGLALIVVDYLQLMRGQSRPDTREQEIAEISRGLKAVAKELNVPVLACAQLNRALETRPNKRPRLSDLRESGAIEQDADVVMFIYRDEVYNPNSEDQGVAELHIAKHRNGPLTTSASGIRLAFIASFTKFATLSQREDESPSTA